METTKVTLWRTINKKKLGSLAHQHSNCSYTIKKFEVKMEKLLSFVQQEEKKEVQEYYLTLRWGGNITVTMETSARKPSDFSVWYDRSTFLMCRMKQHPGPRHVCIYDGSMDATPLGNLMYPDVKLHKIWLPSITKFDMILKDRHLIPEDHKFLHTMYSHFIGVIEEKVF